MAVRKSVISRTGLKVFKAQLQLNYILCYLGDTLRKSIATLG